MKQEHYEDEKKKRSHGSKGILYLPHQLWTATHYS